MGKTATKKIFVIETNKMYDTIAEAARAVGVDPANARKVVRGLRASAGGFHFAEISSAEQKAAAVRAVEVAPVDRARKRLEAQRKRKLVEAVHDIMVDINKRARNAKKENMLDTDPIMQQLLAHADRYGYNKTGGYQTSRTHLRELTVTELENFIELTERTKKEYADRLYDPENAKRNLASLALQFGVNEEQMKNYWHVLPAIFEMFRQANVAQWQYQDIEDEIYDAIQAGADPEDLRDYVLDLTNFYKGNTREDLDDILDKWSTTRTTWEERWE